MIPRFKPRIDWQELKVLFTHNKFAVEKFEKAFAKKFHAVDAVAFPYGRSAQWAFINAVGLKDIDIIMPAYTCSVVAHAIVLSGNNPKFIDINLHDFNMDLEKAESAINPNTRAIIATHTFGYPQDLDRLEAMVKRAEIRYGHKIWLIQDCCHAFGAEWKGKSIGSSGDVAVYALNISKLMTSIFGGMLTFQDQQLADKVRLWRDENFKSAGWLKSIKRRIYTLAVYIAFNEKIYGITWWLQTNTKILNRFTKLYHLDEKIIFPPDYLSKMHNVEAAVGLKQLKKYDDIIQQRRDKVNFYNKELVRHKDWVLPPIVNGATYSHYTVRVQNRDEVINKYALKGVQLGELIQYSIPSLKCYRKLDGINYPNAHQASLETINFPL